MFIDHFSILLYVFPFFQFELSQLKFIFYLLIFFTNDYIISNYHFDHTRMCTLFANASFSKCSTTFCITTHPITLSIYVFAFILTLPVLCSKRNDCCSCELIFQYLNPSYNILPTNPFPYKYIPTSKPTYQVIIGFMMY